MFCGLDMSYFSLTKCCTMPHFKEETFREVMWPASAGKQQGQDEPKLYGILPLSGFLVASGWWRSRIGVNCESTFCLAESGSTGDGGLTKTACSGPCRWVAQDSRLRQESGERFCAPRVRLCSYSWEQLSTGTWTESLRHPSALSVSSSPQASSSLLQLRF